MPRLSKGESTPQDTYSLIETPQKTRPSKGTEACPTSAPGVSAW